MSQRKSCWEVWDEKTKKQAFDFSEKYKDFLNKAKTESEAVIFGIEFAKKNGFKDISGLKSIKAGDKVFSVNRGKSIFFARIGKKGFTDGVKLIMSHIDSPHLDFKVNPLYEDEKLAFLKTHYYGGIKKYQWPTIALALHGTVYLENGKKIEINIGEKDSDPVFMITDLLPHLDRPGAPGGKIEYREVHAEELNLLVGSMPVEDKDVKEKVKLAVLEYLYNEYGIVEEDLASAELQAVPSDKARDLGFDRSLISAHGQDDMACAYPALIGFIEAKDTSETQICAWVDREEIGSQGNTGVKSYFLETFISDLLNLYQGSSSMNETYHIFGKSKAISADVSVAIDPDYKELFDLRNVFHMGYGLAVEKYTGHGGKYSTSDASAKYFQEIRALFKQKNIPYQLGGGMGKIDKGGGGTIAGYLANRNIDVVDMGVSLFNMHAPLEISSKADIYCACLGYRAFFEN